MTLTDVEIQVDQDTNTKKAPDSDDESERSGHSLPPAPDGGWGWVVCFASFLIMVILDGMMFSFGVFFLDLLEYFEESKGKTAMVGSTLMGTHLIMGPFTSAMVNMWGCRPVAMVGSVIAAASFACSIAAPSVEVLAFTYGFVGGIGVSMVYIPAILVVGFYFDRRRALANGIGNSGSGVGAFVFSPLCRFLLDTFGWRGGLLILSGLVLNCAVMSAVFRPIRRDRSSDTSSDNTSESFVADSKALLNRRVKHLREWEEDARVISKSHGDLPSTTSPMQKAAMSNSQLMKKEDSLAAWPITPAVFIPKALDGAVDYRYTQSLNGLGGSNYIPEHLIKSGTIMNKPLYRKDAFYSGSIWRLPESKFYADPESYKVSMLRLNGDGAGSEEEEKKKSYLVDTIRQMIGLSLLRNPVFVLCVISSVLWTTHASVMSILPDYAVLAGCSKGQAGLLLSLIGIANICGRLTAGWLADRPNIDTLWVNGGALACGGCVNLVIPFVTSYPALLSLAFSFGLCMGMWTSLRPIVLVEILGIDRLTNAFGLLAMFQGLAFCIGGPVAGMLFDLTHSYTLPFLMAGCAFLLSCAVCLTTRRVAMMYAAHTRLHHDNSSSLSSCDVDICCDDVIHRKNDVSAEKASLVRSVGCVGPEVQIDTVDVQLEKHIGKTSLGEIGECVVE